MAFTSALAKRRPSGQYCSFEQEKSGKIEMPIVMRELQYILFVKNQVEVVIVDIILQTLGLRFDILCKIRVFVRIAKISGSDM